MKIKNCPNFDYAFRSVMKLDKEYIKVRHTLKKGQLVQPHYHPRANEWIVINHGSFVLEIGKEGKEFHLNRRVVLIHIPVGAAHSLLALTDLSYYVLRDWPDKTIFKEKT